MSAHMEKAVSLADKVVTMAEDGLRPLALSIKHWPPEFSAIVWDAVADIATRRAIANRARDEPTF